VVAWPAHGLAWCDVSPYVGWWRAQEGWRCLLDGVRGVGVGQALTMSASGAADVVELSEARWPARINHRT